MYLIRSATPDGNAWRMGVSSHSVPWNSRSLSSCTLLAVRPAKAKVNCSGLRFRAVPGALSEAFEKEEASCS